MNLTLELSGLNLERLLRAAGACGVRMKNVRRMDERTMRVVVPAAQKKRMAALCEKYGLALIEDAAQSFGAEYHGKKACAFGRIATTSFFPAKPLGCYGDGGAVFTDDDAVNDHIRSLCVHGKGPGGKYDNIRVGMNSRLDNLQAAVLLPKLRALREYEMNQRQAVAKWYSTAFTGNFTTPFVAEGCRSAWAQ